MLYAETDNGAAEVVIYSKFYTSTIDEDAVFEEIYDSLQTDTSEAEAEFTKILFESRYPGQATEGEDCFEDVAVDQWYSKCVCFAKNEGILSGYPDGTFKPAQSVNLAEVLRITLETYFSDIPGASGPWYEKYWLYAEQEDYLLDEWSDASEYLTRGAMAELIYRILN